MLDNDIVMEWSLFVVGFLICLLFVTSGLFNFILSDKEVKQLGQSICEEEYNMDFESYKDRSLKCKPMIKEEHYDGIVVEIGG